MRLASIIGNNLLANKNTAAKRDLVHCVSGPSGPFTLNSLLLLAPLGSTELHQMSFCLTRSTTEVG